MAFKDWERTGRISWTHKTRNEAVWVGKFDSKRYFFEVWKNGRSIEKQTTSTKAQANKLGRDYRRTH